MMALRLTPHRRTQWGYPESVSGQRRGIGSAEIDDVLGVQPGVVKRIYFVVDNFYNFAFYFVDEFCIRLKAFAIFAELEHCHVIDGVDDDDNTKNGGISWWWGDGVKN